MTDAGTKPAQHSPTPENGDFARRRDWRRDVVLRLVMSLALVPIVPAVTGIIVSLLPWQGELIRLQPWFVRRAIDFDTPRMSNLIMAVAFLVPIILVWRRLIIWTLGRTGLTALVGMIPFVQVVVARPLWDVGCTEGIMRMAQGTSSVGIWLWVSVWVWWGMEKWVGARSPRAKPNGRSRMTQMIKPVLMGLALIPISVGLFWILCEASQDLVGMGDQMNYLIAYSGCALVVVAAWLMIWRRRVKWSGSTALCTILATVALIALPVAGSYWASKFSDPWDTTMFMAPLIGWGLWMCCTVHMWSLRLPVDVAENAEPHCPACGYNLSGLTHTRCPECGAEPTLEKLRIAVVDTAG